MVAVQFSRDVAEGKAEMEGVGESIRVMSSDWRLERNENVGLAWVFDGGKDEGGAGGCKLIPTAWSRSGRRCAAVVRRLASPLRAWSARRVRSSGCLLGRSPF